MLDCLQGTLKECSPQHAVIEAMGLGFHVFIPASFYFQMPAAGSKITIYTYLQIKDDEPVLYGFPGKKERDFFKVLIRVSGIGPKTALSLLGHLSLSQLFRAILQEDLDALIRTPGIGKKTANRLVYELKDKVDKEQLETESADSRGKLCGGHWDDLQEALQALGYSPKEINRVQKGIREEEEYSNLEELFKRALVLLAKKK